MSDETLNRYWEALLERNTSQQQSMRSDCDFDEQLRSILDLLDELYAASQQLPGGLVDRPRLPPATPGKENDQLP